MKKYILVCFSIFYCIFLYAVEYSFTLPVKGNAIVTENSEVYTVKLTFKRTKVFSQAQNAQADYSYSEVVLNKALTTHLKIKDKYEVSYSGRILLDKFYDDDSCAIFTYQVTKKSISIQKSTATPKEKNASSKIKNIKDMPLMGYSLRYKSDVITLINSYQNKLSELIDNIDDENIESLSANFKKIYNEAKSSFDENLLKNKFNKDAKLMISDVKQLLSLAKSASKNFEILNSIFEKQLQIAKTPFSDANTQLVKNLSAQIDSLKNSLIKIKE